MIEKIIIPEQLRNPDFRFVPLRPKGQPMGKDSDGNQIISTGKEPSQAWKDKALALEDPALTRHLEQGGNYAVACGHGRLMVLDIDHESAFSWLDTLPETFTVKSGGKGLPHLYYQVDLGEGSGFSRKIPLTDEQVEQYADLVLKEGTKSLTKLQLETLFDLQGKGQLATGPNSKLDENSVYTVYCDTPIASVDMLQLKGILESYGTTLKDEKARIIALARQKSPEFDKNMEERENRPVDHTAPWFLPLWKTIIETVGVSGVYDFMGEPFSTTGRNRCLLGHTSKSGQTVQCENNLHWHCHSCGESGDAWELFKQIKGADKANGKSTFYDISPEFAALAGGNYRAEWQTILDERRKAKKDEWKNRKSDMEANALAMLQKMNEEHFVSTDANAAGIAKVTEDINGQLDVKLFSEKNFITMYKNRIFWKLEYDPTQKKTVEKPYCLPKEWLKWEGRREHLKGWIFMPRDLTAEEERFWFNTWRGFQVEAKEGVWDKIRYHLLHVWCRDNEDEFHYLMSWFAHLFQKPWEKPSVAILVKGGKGSGKSIIMDKLLAPILGPAYCQLDKDGQVTGRFNAHQYGKLLMSLEEAVWAGAKNAEGALKTLISSPITFLEGKGKDGKNVDSFSRIIFLSNERRAVPATLGERRFFALKTNDDKRKDQAYFDALIHEIDNGGREAFFHAAMNYEGLQIVGMHPPMTEALLEDIEEGLEPLQKWFYYLLDSFDAIFGYSPVCADGGYESQEKDKYECYCVWGTWMSVADLQKKFQQWLEENKRNNAYIGYSSVSDLRVFSRELNKMFGEKPDKNKPNKQKKKMDNTSHFLMPEIETARKIFEEAIGRELPWMITDIREEDIFRDTSEHRKVVDKFRLACQDYRSEVEQARTRPELHIDPDSIPVPIFEEVKAKVKAEAKVGMDTFIKKPKE